MNAFLEATRSFMISPTTSNNPNNPSLSLNTTPPTGSHEVEMAIAPSSRPRNLVNPTSSHGNGDAFSSAAVSTFSNQKTPSDSIEPDFKALAQEFKNLRDAEAAKGSNCARAGGYLLTRFLTTYAPGSRRNKRKLLTAVAALEFPELIKPPAIEAAVTARKTFIPKRKIAERPPAPAVQTSQNNSAAAVQTSEKASSSPLQLAPPSAEQPSLPIWQIYQNPPLALHFFILALLFERKESKTTVPQFVQQHKYGGIKPNYASQDLHYSPRTEEKFLQDARYILGLLNDRKNYVHSIKLLASNKLFLGSLTPDRPVSSHFDTTASDSSVLQIFKRQRTEAQSTEFFHLNPDYTALKLNRPEIIALLKNFLANFHPGNLGSDSESNSGINSDSNIAKYFLEFVLTHLEKQEEEEAQIENAPSPPIDLVHVSLGDISVADMIKAYLRE